MKEITEHFTFKFTTETESKNSSFINKEVILSVTAHSNRGHSICLDGKYGNVTFAGATTADMKRLASFLIRTAKKIEGDKDFTPDLLKK